MAKMTFFYDDRALRTRLKALPDKVDRQLSLVADYHATEGTVHMKENAPWTDRTTNARNGLHAQRPPKEGNKHVIIFAHTMHYGIFLELANSGRYEIIMPTVRHEGQLLMSRLHGLFRKIDT